VLHILPQEFIIDGQEARAARHERRRLEVKVHIVTGVSGRREHHERGAAVSKRDVMLQPLRRRRPC
jgi:hypothetical protein